MKIGIDIDDVMADFVPEFLKWYNHNYGEDLVLDDITSFDLTKIFKYPKKTIDNIIHNFYQSKEFTHLPIVKNTNEALNGLPYYEKHIITSRPITTSLETIKWVENNINFNYDGIYIGVKDKGELGKKIGLDYMIDDASHHIESCAKNGITPILFNRKWNQECKEGIRIKDWYSIYKYLRNDDSC